MRVFDKDKMVELKIYDLEKGYLKEDQLITHIPHSPEIKEQGHYAVLHKSAHGQSLEWVVDTQYKAEVKEHDVVENILVYVPYTEVELGKMANEKQIADLKAYLAETDYMVIKCMERGESMQVSYPAVYAKRAEARERINGLERLFN